MKSLNSKLNFNKIRNKKEKLKTRFKKEKKVKKEKEPKPKIDKRKTWYIVLTIITALAILAVFTVIAFAAYIVITAPEFTEAKLFNKDSTVIYYNDNQVSNNSWNECRKW